MVSQQKQKNTYIDEKLNLNQVSLCTQIPKIILTFRNVFMNYILFGWEYQQDCYSFLSQLPPPDFKDTGRVIDF